MNIYDSYRTPEDLPGNEAVRVATLLNIDDAEELDSLVMADRVTHGLQVGVVGAAVQLIGSFGKDAIQSILSASTLQRARKRRRLSPEISSRIYDIGRVFDQAAIVFHGDKGKIERFMMRPNPMLEQRTPYEVACSSSAGANIVINLLAEAQAGVAA